MHAATCPAAMPRHLTARATPVAKDPPLPLWLTAWIGGACVVLILNFDSMVWDRVPITLAMVSPPGGGVDAELVKALAALVAALTPLAVGLVSATFAGVAKVILAWRGKADPQPADRPATTE